MSEVDSKGTALGIADPDDNNCPRLVYAVAHLTGTAAEWYTANKTAMGITRWGGGANDNIKLKTRLRTAFLTPERQQR